MLKKSAAVLAIAGLLTMSAQPSSVFAAEKKYSFKVTGGKSANTKSFKIGSSKAKICAVWMLPASSGIGSFSHMRYIWKLQKSSGGKWKTVKTEAPLVVGSGFCMTASTSKTATYRMHVEAPPLAGTHGDVGVTKK
ncbi:hypothetical protein LRR81_13480 [Metabacillus sp. GX 13764]|uniref:hypothetical protein n=1 Tax=Metabacillus kandeliae TaxID=2900151 RepID=UPI001E415326|nr:hypothetical protein [Metabacillus kandeliae]MCD7035253.1 hypothetical protein [Metabacillus kandeliae]